MSAANIACVVLASGLSERFGVADKLSTDLCGQLMVSHVLEAAREVGYGEIFIVSQAQYADGSSWIRNETPELGQGHTLRIGLQAARDSGWESCAVLLGDMPLITSLYLKNMIEKYDCNQSIVSISETIRMPPVLFNVAAMDVILSKNTVKGARDLFDLINPSLMALDTNMALDVDTLEDLDRLRNIMKASKI